MRFIVKTTTQEVIVFVTVQTHFQRDRTIKKFMASEQFRLNRQNDTDHRCSSKHLLWKCRVAKRTMAHAALHS